MRYRIRHITEYRYANRVSHCYNLAHMIPRSTRRQTSINSRIDVSPTVAQGTRRTDYFGNSAYHFEIQKPHRELVITSSCEVETGSQIGDANLDIGRTCGEARKQLVRARSEEVILAREYQLESSMIRADDQLRDFAKDLFSDERPLLTAVSDLTQRIFEEFKYSPAATTIATPIAEVMASRKGVCQDFAHLQIGCLRAMGFAAKYVSGYLETLPPPGQEKMVGADATHAWLSVYSPGEGWFEFDPTNNTMAGEQHIITAWGRDFYDVTPLRGVIFGGGSDPAMTVSVDVTRI